VVLDDDVTRAVVIFLIVVKAPEIVAMTVTQLAIRFPKNVGSVLGTPTVGTPAGATKANARREYFAKIHWTAR